MILLLGGTGGTAAIAERLAREGYRVLVSKATDVPLAVGDHPIIECRWGPLDDDGLAALIRSRQIRAVVDATHPYAAVIRARAARIAGQLGIPYWSLTRAAAIDGQAPGVEFAADHPSAAALAFAHGRPVLLTTGAKNLAPYAEEARRTGWPLIARVLDRPESLDACRRAGIAPQQIIAGRGPYSVAENRRQIRAFGIGVLVTKDSGPAGGTAEKLQAAAAENCRVVAVQRPVLAGPQALIDVEQLVQALAGIPRDE